MENNIRVSVIIPVYNAEKYLCECLDSVVNQTLREIEIICVDDGSTDNSLAILREYEAQDERVKVLTQENQYAGVARNNGMAVAQGEYFAFLDADDYYASDALKNLFDIAQREDLDVVKASFYNVDGSECTTSDYSTNKNIEHGIVLNFEQDYLRMLRISDVPWNGLYRASFIRENAIIFNSLKCSNDHSFFVECMIKAERVAVVDDFVTYYRINQESSLIGKKSKNFQCQIDSYNTVRILTKNLPFKQKRHVMKYELNSLFYWYGLMRAKLDQSGKQQIDEIVKGFIRDYEEGDVGSEHLRIMNGNMEYSRLKREIEENDCHSRYSCAISIIIPVYNVEAYLAECIESAMRQTLSDIEIICVDDGSTDNSRSILQKYAEKDPRIKLVLNDANRGTLEARKRGILAANGEYIMFLDADDLFAEEACAEALSLIRRKGVDILQFSGKVADAAPGENEWISKTLIPNEMHASAESIFEALFVRCSHNTALWGKIYHSHVCINACQGMTIIYYKIGEDIFQQFLFCFYADSFEAVRTKPLYMYRYGAGVSNAQKVSLSKFEQYCRMAELVQHTRIFLENEHCLGRYEKYCTAMAERMATDCCRMYKARVLESDKSDAGQLLLRYWGQEVVTESVVKRILGTTTQELERTCIAVPVYTKLATAYADGTTPKVSVIVPVYNVEKYLRECLDSVINQTLREIEIICVNDGSWDNSLQIIEEYADRDNRITVVSQKNGGLSAARNAGIQHICGEYVCFLDSDDMLEVEALEELYACATKYKVDILFYGATSLFVDKRVKSKHCSYETYYMRKGEYTEGVSGEGLLVALTMNKEYRSSACLQMIRNEHLKKNSIAFLNGILHEDNLFTFQNLLQAERTAVINEPYYIRRVRDDSIMTRPTRFANTYGYLMCFAHMMAFVTERTYDESVMSAIMTLINGMRWGVQRTYGELPNEERAKVAELKPLEQMWFELAMMNVKKGEKATLPKAVIAAKAYGTNEAALIRASWSYRIGRFITWPYRMARGFYRCYQEHGWRYTWRRVLVKLHITKY